MEMDGNAITNMPLTAHYKYPGHCIKDISWIEAPDHHTWTHRSVFGYPSITHHSQWYYSRTLPLFPRETFTISPPPNILCHPQNKAHLTVAFLLLQLVCVSFGGPVIETTTKVTPSKRSLIGFGGFEEGGGGGWPNEWNQFNGNPWGGQNIHQAWYDLPVPQTQ